MAMQLLHFFKSNKIKYWVSIFIIGGILTGIPLLLWEDVTLTLRNKLILMYLYMQSLFLCGIFFEAIGNLLKKKDEKGN